MLLGGQSRHVNKQYMRINVHSEFCVVSVDYLLLELICYKTRVHNKQPGSMHIILVFIEGCRQSSYLEIDFCTT